MKIYIVASLPRTGTTSLCKMATSCGLKSKHVLGEYKFKDLIKTGHSFFADTPFYIPEFLIGMIESLSDACDINLIYSHRLQDIWSESFSKLIQRWTPIGLDSIHKSRLHDILGYMRITPDTIISDHYEYIKEISNVYNVPILDYSFDDGWVPFCNFLNVPIPEIEVPHINKS